MKQKITRRFVSEPLAAFIFLLPSLCGVFIFVILPFGEAFRRSFMNARATEYVGLQNYFSVAANPAFVTAAQNTAKFICICVPLLLLISLILAIWIRSCGKSRGTFKTIFLLPMAIPVASIVLLWQVLFNNSGLVNGIITSLGGEAVSFMQTDAAFWVLIGTYVWKNAGYDMILWLCGLDGISDSLYEAASADGASSAQTFFYITLPQLVPTLVLTSVLSLVNTFKVFREAYLVAGAYPDESIYLLQHLFNNWFTALDLPRLSAAAIIVAAVLLIFILILQRFWTED